MDARLFRKAPGQAAKLAYMGHVLMENRSCLVVDARLTLATGTAEREAALAMLEDVPGRHRITLDGDEGYDAASFVAALRALNAPPHVAQNTSHLGPPQRLRRPHDPPRGLPGEPDHPQPHRGGIRPRRSPDRRRCAVGSRGLAGLPTPRAAWGGSARDGPRRPHPCARPGIVVSSGSAGSSRSPPPPTTSSASPSCSRRSNAPGIRPDLRKPPARRPRRTVDRPVR